MELKKKYVFDECSDSDILFEKLEELRDDGKISFIEDGWSFQIEDIELEDKEIKELLDLFDDIDVYESEDDSEEDWSDEDSDWD